MPVPIFTSAKMAAENAARVDLILKLFEIDALKFGKFTLKSGIESPVYFDLRVIISYPKILQQIADEMWKSTVGLKNKFSHVCGVPYTALPIATCVSTKYDIPMIMKRKEAKSYGTKKLIEGSFKDNSVCLVLEDVVTTGSSVLETVTDLANVGVIVKDAIVLLDRCQGGKESLAANGIQLHSVLTLKEVLDVLQVAGKVHKEMVEKVDKFIKENVCKVANMVPENSIKQLSYEQRGVMASNPVAKKLFTIMHNKKTNLCISVDMTSSQAVLQLVDNVGPYVCLVKTHVDILTDFSQNFVSKLQDLAKQHNFLIFEDRKFADIGNTVKYQYGAGLYSIANWADIVNAHSVPGESVLTGLKEVGNLENRACLMIAQMSSAGNLALGEYTLATVKMAEDNKDFVIGFISTSCVSGNPAFIHMTPGVKLAAGSDALGQQYLTPEEVIKNRGSDIMIVGRGIYEASDPTLAAQSYQEAGYTAYMEKLSA